VRWMFKCVACEALVVSLWQDFEVGDAVCVDCLDWRYDDHVE
jgi:hypothetical protein